MYFSALGFDWSDLSTVSKEFWGVFFSKINFICKEKLSSLFLWLCSSSLSKIRIHEKFAQHYVNWESRALDPFSENFWFHDSLAKIFLLFRSMCSQSFCQYSSRLLVLDDVAQISHGFLGYNSFNFALTDSCNSWKSVIAKLRSRFNRVYEWNSKLYLNVKSVFLSIQLEIIGAGWCCTNFSWILILLRLLLYNQGNNELICLFASSSPPRTVFVFKGNFFSLLFCFCWLCNWNYGGLRFEIKYDA